MRSDRERLQDLPEVKMEMTARNADGFPAEPAANQAALVLSTMRSSSGSAT